jgi:hypothetical protein
MTKLKQHLIAVVAAVAGIHSANAQTWDGVVVGQISDVHASIGIGNYEFRVNLKDNGMQWCGSSNAGAVGWAGLHSTDPNYKTAQSVLLMAAATGRTVTLYLTRDGNGFCKIGYAVIKG